MKTDEITRKYEVEESIENGLAMIGVIKPREIVQQISGFVPVFDVVINHFNDHLTALIFGRRWQFCRMVDGVCRASLSKIAKSLSLDEATVMRHTEKLVKDGFLIDLTPDRRNRPHVYADAGRVVMKSQIGVELKSIAQSNTTVAQSNTGIAESQLIKDSNKDSNSLSPQEIEQVNKKVDKILELNQKQALHWKGREFFRDNHLPYADWYNSKTNQTCGKKFQRSWQKAFSDWQDSDLEVKHLQAAYEQDISWRKVFTDPNELTKKAIAIKASVTQEEPKQRTESSGHYA